MRESVLPRLCCAACRGNLAWKTFRAGADGVIEEGVAWCEHCRGWYPIEESLLELLPPDLAYHEDRRRFWQRCQTELSALGLEAPAQQAAEPSAAEAQRHQQQHFDWYGNNDGQTYGSYSEMPFWRAVDDLTFADWKKQVRPGGWLLDVGCAQGRSTFPFMDLPLHIVAFDISKVLIRQAVARYRSRPHQAEATFFVGDGSRLPVRDQSFDHMLFYGVLHHLPDPAHTCREIARILKPGGSFFACENNRTIFRGLFDLLMKVKLLWKDEPGTHSLMTAADLRQWFAQTDVQLDCSTRVFAPPHLVNLLGYGLGSRFLRGSDWLGRAVPFLQKSGGLLLIRGRRGGANGASPEGG